MHDVPPHAGHLLLTRAASIGAAQRMVSAYLAHSDSLVTDTEMRHLGCLAAFLRKPSSPCWPWQRTACRPPASCRCRASFSSSRPSYRMIMQVLTYACLQPNESLARFLF